MPEHWGIFNSVEKRFVFGIDKPTKAEAWKEFGKKYPLKYIPYRYDARRIPKKRRQRNEVSKMWRDNSYK